jgi:hypothetical protein
LAMDVQSDSCSSRGCLSDMDADGVRASNVVVDVMQEVIHIRMWTSALIMLCTFLEVQKYVHFWRSKSARYFWTSNSYAKCHRVRTIVSINLSRKTLK